MRQYTKKSVVLSVEHEEKVWSDLFKREVKNKNDKLYSSFWWEDYYHELKMVVNPLITDRKHTKILEAGSGSGKGSIVAFTIADLTLLDISSNALKFAEIVAKKFRAKNVKYVNKNITSMPFKPQTFDIVWNIGVIEHYSQNESRLLLSKMIKVVKPGGYIMIGVPNFKSPQTIKAKLLSKHRALNFIPGYRLDSERAYYIKDIEQMLKHAAKSQNRKLNKIESSYVGKPIFVGSPKIVVNTLGVLAEKLFPHRKFLILVRVKVL